MTNYISSHTSFYVEHFVSTIPNYLMKVDDDTFVNLPKLYSTLMSEDKYNNVTDLMMGYCHCHSRVYKVSKY